jgi:hypothetical protein
VRVAMTLPLEPLALEGKREPFAVFRAKRAGE